MKMTNEKIYTIAQQINKELADLTTYIPAKANFLMQKNMNTIMEAAKEIDNTKINIAKNYGTLNEESQQYTIPNDKMEVVNKELKDLFSIEQDLSISTVKIDDFGNAEFTPQQMAALIFMIKEE